MGKRDPAPFTCPSMSSPDWIGITVTPNRTSYKGGETVLKIVLQLFPFTFKVCKLSVII